MIAAGFLILLGIYLACGLVFAVPFVFKGAGKQDPPAAKGTWGFRILIIPGSMALWPVMLRRWMSGASNPPEERDAHRRRAAKEASI